MLMLVYWIGNERRQNVARIIEILLSCDCGVYSSLLRVRLELILCAQCELSQETYIISTNK